MNLCAGTGYIGVYLYDRTGLIWLFWLSIIHLHKTLSRIIKQLVNYHIDLIDSLHHCERNPQVPGIITLGLDLVEYVPIVPDTLMLVVAVIVKYVYSGNL